MSTHFLYFWNNVGGPGFESLIYVTIALNTIYTSDNTNVNLTFKNVLLHPEINCCIMKWQFEKNIENNWWLRIFDFPPKLYRKCSCYYHYAEVHWRFQLYNDHRTGDDNVYSALGTSMSLSLSEKSHSLNEKNLWIFVNNTKYYPEADFQIL